MKVAQLTLILLSILVYPLYGQRKHAASPDFAVVQHAGSIGYFSVGTGYDIFKSKGKLSVHFGSVPKTFGGPLNILAAKIFYEPKVIRLWSNMEVNPFDVGLMFSYHFGNNFKLSVPDYFSADNYYWWHTALRAHLAIESSFTWRFEPDRIVIKGFTGYLELNTNDLYLVSFIDNTHSLKLQDIIKVGIGTRFLF